MTRPLLLDTCACIWLMEGTLVPAAHEALIEAYAAGIPTFVSPITALEIGSLSRKRRVKSPLDPQKWFDGLLGRPGMLLADMPPALLIASQFLPDYVGGDPFDRIIAATARQYGFVVMTRDRELVDYGVQGYLSVLMC